MELAVAVHLHRQPSQRIRTISFYELPLEHLDSPQQSLVILGNVLDLLIQKLDVAVRDTQLLMQVHLLKLPLVQLILQPHYFLLEDDDQLLLLEDQLLRDGLLESWASMMQ